MTPTAPSYWFWASRTPAMETPSLAPPPVLFRPESGLALDAGDLTNGDLANEAEPTPIVRSTTPTATPAEVPRLAYGVPRPVLSAPLAPWVADVGWAASETKENPHVLSKSAFTPHPNHPRKKGEEHDSLDEPTRPVAMQSVPIIRVERVHETKTLEREVASPSAPITPKFVAALIQPAPQAAAIPATAIEADPPTRGAKAETRSPWRPPAVLTPPIRVAPPKQQPTLERLPPTSERDLPPPEETVERTELRIGSIVVHLDPPAPRPVPQAPAPVAAKPSVSLQRGFAAFGFYQS